MNLSAAIMLVNEGVRPVKVEYDPDIARNNNPNKLFKTLDKSIKKDDLVIVQTNTRHGFTVAKVSEIDFPVDFNSAEQWGWVAGKLDKTTFDEMISIEKNVQTMVAKATENKMRAELKAAAGLGNVDFSEVQAALRPPAPAVSAEILPPPAPPTTPPPHTRPAQPQNFAPPPIDDDEFF